MLKSFIGHDLEFQSTACPYKLFVVDAVECCIYMLLFQAVIFWQISFVICSAICTACLAVLLNHVPTAAYRSLKVLS